MPWDICNTTLHDHKGEDEEKLGQPSTVYESNLAGIIFGVFPQKSIWWTFILVICGTIVEHMSVLYLRAGGETTTNLALRPVPARVCTPNDDVFHLTTCVRGYHIYKNVWNPSFGDEFSYQIEEGNLQDPQLW